MKKGFTLAEVLITLVIIGVIGALTVPALIQNTQKQEYVSALKKAYSTLSQAVNLIIMEEGKPAPSAGGWAVSNEAIYNMFLKHLNTAKACGTGAGCFTGQGSYRQPLGQKWLDLENDGRFWKLILAGGIQVVFAWYDENKARCTDDKVCTITEIFVDVNGAKKPNVIGRDFFQFLLTNDGLKLSSCGVPDKCSVSKNYGWGCACKVLTEGAMNY